MKTSHILMAIVLSFMSTLASANNHCHHSKVVYIDQHPTIYHPQFFYGERIHRRNIDTPTVQYVYAADWTPDMNLCSQRETRGHCYRILKSY